MSLQICTKGYRLVFVKFFGGYRGRLISSLQRERDLDVFEDDLEVQQE